MTIAQKIADRFDNDGQTFTDASGVPLADICRDGKVGYAHDGFDQHRWTFSDGSSIVIAGESWDFGFDGFSCFCFAGGNHGHHAHDCVHAEFEPWCP